MNIFRKYRKQIFFCVLAVFVFYIAIGFGTGFFGPKGAPTDALIEVNGQSIPLYTYYNHYNRAMAQLPPNTAVTPEVQNAKRDETVRDLIQGVVFEEQAEHFGLDVPDQQVAMSLAQVPAFQEKGVFSPQAYVRVLQYQLRTTPKEFEEEQRRAIQSFKLNWLIRSSIKMSDDEYAWLKSYVGSAIANELSKDPKAKHTPEQLDAQIREQLWQQKVVWGFNQWFQRLGQQLKVKTHFDLLKGGN